MRGKGGRKRERKREKERKEEMKKREKMMGYAYGEKGKMRH